MSSDLPSRIEALADDEAVRLVTLLAKVEGDPTDTALLSDRRAALRDAFDATPPSSVDAGELARAALQLHAQAPENHETLDELMEDTTPERFLNGFSVDLVTAALILLKNHLRIERDPDGNWLAVVEMETASTDLLRTVVRQLLGYDEN